MSRDSTTRRQVKAAIIDCMVKANAEGRDEFEAARTEFPGVPVSVLGECAAEADDIEVEAWWRTVERTIDGELIKNAVATTAKKEGR
jgi:hypothetical protein